MTIIGLPRQSPPVKIVENGNLSGFSDYSCRFKLDLQPLNPIRYADSRCRMNQAYIPSLFHALNKMFSLHAFAGSLASFRECPFSTFIGICTERQFLWLILYVWLLFCPAWAEAIQVDIAKPAPVDSSGDQIASLLRQLDSDSFQLRENGLQGLSNAGLAAVRPLAMQILEGSPESSWRSKQALESIGIQGNEETFLKTAAILKLLYVGTSDSLAERVNELELNWKLEQKRSILRQLQEKGARVIDSSDSLGMGNNLALWQVMEGLDPTNGEKLSSTHQLASRTTNSVSKRPFSEIISEVDEILDASVEDNRERLFGASSTQQASFGEQTLPGEINPELLLELQMQRRLGGFGQGQMLNRNQGALVDGISIILDRQWNGNEHDLARLSELADLRRIEIEEIGLDDEQVTALAKASLITSLRITGNQLPSERLLTLCGLSRIQDVEFVRRDLTTTDVECLAQLPNLLALIFSNVKFPNSGLERLAECRRLGSVSLIDMHVASSVLAHFAEIPNLRMIHMDLCKFEIASYRKFKTQRPEINISFNPQAFLGVRDSVNRTVEGCEISQVIPNSGADRGGIKPGDIVRKINGEGIDSFEDLRLHVAQHQSGDVLIVVVEREKTEIELKIQLSPFQPVD